MRGSDFGVGEQEGSFLYGVGGVSGMIGMVPCSRGSSLLVFVIQIGRNTRLGILVLWTLGI